MASSCLCFAGYKTIPKNAMKLNYFNILRNNNLPSASCHFERGSTENRSVPFCSAFAPDVGVRLRGKFRFKASVSGGDEIDDSYKLEIVVPNKFPQALPKVKEAGGKIPRDGDFHVNQDGTLCLGSPLRLLRKVHSAPSLTGFADKCLVPYLYAVSYKLKHGGDFIFGELAHGDQGIVDDYSVMLGLRERHQITQAIQLLGVKKRIANKRPCPCGCGKRFGACPFRHRLNEFRKMAPVSWFKAHALNDWNRI